MSLLANDLACIMADASLFVPVIAGAVTTRGRMSYMDVPQQDHTGDVVLVKERSVVVQASVVPAIARGDSITVDGTSYIVRDLRNEAQGNLLRVVVA